tara:strand:- start:154 stop:447 length:294 start_codon:yes stop_codon:yes gene_type:complete
VLNKGKKKMKLTKEVLKQIIKEEIQAVLNEEKMVVELTDSKSISAAANAIARAKQIKDSMMIDKLKKAIKQKEKKVLIVGGPNDGRMITLSKHVTYK